MKYPEENTNTVRYFLSHKKQLYIKRAYKCDRIKDIILGIGMGCGFVLCFLILNEDVTDLSSWYVKVLAFVFLVFSVYGLVLREIRNSMIENAIKKEE